MAREKRGGVDMPVVGDARRLLDGQNQRWAANQVTVAKLRNRTRGGMPDSPTTRKNARMITRIRVTRAPRAEVMVLPIPVRSTTAPMSAKTRRPASPSTKVNLTRLSMTTKPMTTPRPGLGRCPHCAWFPSSQPNAPEAVAGGAPVGGIPAGEPRRVRPATGRADGPIVDTPRPVQQPAAQRSPSQQPLSLNPYSQPTQTDPD